MEKYIIIIKDVFEFPHLKTDLYGRPLQFDSYDEALPYKEQPYEEIIKINY